MKTIRWRQISRPEDGLHVATIETRRKASPDQHDHDFYECFLVLEGRGRHILDAGTEDLVPQTLYFVRPEHSHAILGERDLVFINVAFEATIFARIESVAQLPSGCWERGTPIKQIRLRQSQVTEVLDAVMEAAQVPSVQNAAWLLLSLARTLERHTRGRSEAGRTMPEWFSEGLARASEAEVLSGGLPALVRRMGRSRKQVGRCFREYLGMTPTEWLTRERIEHAALLLTTTRRPVLDIAMDCGFESPSHFHKCFRAVHETTPLQYRSKRSAVQV